jgi:hypothetical protein
VLSGARFGPSSSHNYTDAGSLYGKVKQGHHVSSPTQQPGQQPHLRPWGGSSGDWSGVGKDLREGGRRISNFMASRRGGEEEGLPPLEVPQGMKALGAGAPQAYQGFSTSGPGYPMPAGPMTELGPARTPALDSGNQAIGALGPATARPGGPAPTPRPQGPIIEASSTPVLPGTGEDMIPRVGAPLPSTRSVRGRRSSFNPNQGTMLG